MEREKSSLEREKSGLPNVLVVTDDCISTAHGTGTSLIRHFSRYPESQLLNIYPMRRGEPIFKFHYQATPQLLPYLFTSGLARLRLHQSSLYNLCERFYFSRNFRLSAQNSEFIPDIIYAACSTRRGFMLLGQLEKKFPDVPIIQHFLDYLPFGFNDVPYLVRRLSPSITEIWSLTETLIEELEPLIERPFQLVRIFHCDLPQHVKSHHREFNSDFQAVMIGNCWIPTLLIELRKTWKWLGDITPGLGPIRWYCHPDSVEWIRQQNITPEPEIEFCGFRTGEELLEQLRQADIAIIPFNGEGKPENEYARFSLPSRITEMASVGLPIFCSAGPGTEVKRYIESKDIGFCSLLNNQEQFQQDLLDFVMHRERRSYYGQNARKLAENEFNLAQYQRWLYEKLRQLS